MSLFDPSNPSKQVAVVSAEPTVYPGSGHTDTIDITGFRQLLFGVNVPGGPGFPVPGAGSTIEIDGLGPDGLWVYQIQPPFPISAVGVNLLRSFGALTDRIRVTWTLLPVATAGAFGYWVVGQS